MFILKESVTVYFNDSEEKTFNSMMDALVYAHTYGSGKKVKFKTSKEFVKC